MNHVFVRNCWYVAAWSHEVGDGLLARTVLGQPLCLVRDRTGTVVAMADRCAHRGAPLSLGRREVDGVRCLYHGVKFGFDGACAEVPGQSDRPRSLCVRTFPVVERHRWIWIWMGDPARADAEAIPDAWPLAHEGWPYRSGYYHYAAPHLLICDNLLDFSHLAFLHPTTLGGTEAIARQTQQVEPRPHGVRIERWLIGDVPAPFHTRVARFDGPVDRWHFYDFLVPGVLLMHSGVQPTGTGAPQGRYTGALQFRSCQAVTPETPTTSHYFYAVPRNFAVTQDEVTQQIHQDVVTAFEEDRIMIEAQARRLADSTASPPMTPIAADAALVQFRRVMLQRWRAEQPAPAPPAESRTEPS